jgi:hypothetical protein
MHYSISENGNAQAGLPYEIAFLHKCVGGQSPEPVEISFGE